MNLRVCLYGKVYCRHPYLCCPHRRTAWREIVIRTRSLFALRLLFFTSYGLAFAQQPEGPQTSAPPPVAPEARPARREGTSDKITVPDGTRVAVVLENGISTRSAKAGDSL